MTDPSRALVFGRNAETYDAARPSYPPEAIAHIKSLTSIDVALEIGAGTGKATVDMAGPGIYITAVEPSPQMAAILRSRRLAGVSVEVAKFEDWEGPVGQFDLVYAAQAWHWVDHSVGYNHTLELLRSGGVLALMWNIPHDRYATFQEVYETHAPELLEERDRRIQMRDSVTWGDDMAAAGFADVDRSTVRWTDTLDPDQIRALYSTYSDHVMLPEHRRVALLDGLASAVDEMGGEIELDYRTEVFSGHKN